jgi:hypothetical protein
MDFNIQEIQDNLLQSKTFKVAVPAILSAPVTMPILHGLAGIAVAGLTVFAAGSLISKTAEAISGIVPLPEKQNDTPEE